MANDTVDKITPLEYKYTEDELTGFNAQEIDTIDLSALNMASSLNIGASGSSYTITTAAGANGTSGSYYYSSQPSSWSTVNIPTGLSQGLHVQSDAVFEGDIKWKGRSLGKLLETIEDRLAILQDPDPKKLEKFPALKKAYDHYKLMEKLIGDEDGS